LPHVRTMLKQNDKCVQININTPHFDVKADVKEHITKAIMIIKDGYATTGSYPNTETILKKYFPQVLDTKCYNKDDIPFSRELKNTETAHLLEHIIIQKLAYRRFDVSGFDKVYRGETIWAINESPLKKFVVVLNSTISDMDILPDILKESSILLDAIMANTMNIDIPVTHVYEDINNR
jgi:hypothetical protein